MPQLIRHGLLGGNMSTELYNAAGSRPPSRTTAKATWLLRLQLPLATYWPCSGTLPSNRSRPTLYGGWLCDVKKDQGANTSPEAARLLATMPAAETAAIIATSIRPQNHSTQCTSYCHIETSWIVAQLMAAEMIRCGKEEVWNRCA